MYTINAASLAHGTPNTTHASNAPGTGVLKIYVRVLFARTHAHNTHPKTHHPTTPPFVCEICARYMHVMLVYSSQTEFIWCSSQKRRTRTLDGRIYGGFWWLINCIRVTPSSSEPPGTYRFVLAAYVRCLAYRKNYIIATSCFRRSRARRFYLIHDVGAPPYVTQFWGNAINIQLRLRDKYTASLFRERQRGAAHMLKKTLCKV